MSGSPEPGRQANVEVLGISRNLTMFERLVRLLVNGLHGEVKEKQGPDSRQTRWDSRSSRTSMRVSTWPLSSAFNGAAS